MLTYLLYSMNSVSYTSSWLHALVLLAPMAIIAIVRCHYTSVLQWFTFFFCLFLQLWFSIYKRWKHSNQLIWVFPYISFLAKCIMWCVLQFVAYISLLYIYVGVTGTIYMHVSASAETCKYLSTIYLMIPIAISTITCINIHLWLFLCSSGACTIYNHAYDFVGLIGCKLEIWTYVPFMHQTNKKIYIVHTLPMYRLWHWPATLVHKDIPPVTVCRDGLYGMPIHM